MVSPVGQCRKQCIEHIGRSSDEFEHVKLYLGVQGLSGSYTEQDGEPQHPLQVPGPERFV
jgi:hypothetical protein